MAIYHKYPVHVDMNIYIYTYKHYEAMQCSYG